MSRMLAIISVIGLALCAAFLGGAWALGGDDIFHDQRSLQGLKPLIDMATRKEWHWAGGDTLAMDAPMTLRYEPQSKANGGRPNVSVTGPADAMDHIRFRAGRITADSGTAPRDKAKVQAVISGVPIRKFVVNGGENLQLGHIDQDELTVHINGAGMVSGDGRVRDLTLVLSGPGQADLGALQVRDASVSILGPGQVTLSPHGDVKLFVVGSAEVRLLTKPENLQRRIFGGATIRTPDGTETAQPPHPPVEATPATPPTPPTPMPAPMPMPMPVPRVAGAEAGANAGNNAGAEAGANAGNNAGPRRDRVSIHSKESINLGHIDQDRLIVEIAGEGSFTAEGRVDRLDVHILGQGNANLSGLLARQVKVDIAGSGNVIVAPTDQIKVNIAGSGNVRLATKPGQIERRIFGSGRVIEAP